jgi:hypothetical protein
MAETDVKAAPTTTGTRKSAVPAARAKAPEPVAEPAKPAVSAPKVPRPRVTTTPTVTIPGLYLG